MISRVFTLQDQLRFAELSGDSNPMHVDPLAARRLMFGRPVVHGINALLWAIDSLMQQLNADGKLVGPLRIAASKSIFRAPILVDDPVKLTITPAKDGRWRLEVSNNGTKLATTILTLENQTELSGAASIPRESSGKIVCRERTAAGLADASGSMPLYLSASVSVAMFPNLTRWLPIEQIATIVATSRLVGMEIPGLNSLFTGLDLQSSNPITHRSLDYKASEFDPRFSMLNLMIQGAGLSGTISAALRPAPAKQAGISELQKLVKPGEFADQRALVVGGSRGLGEVIVKLLIAGGADVRFTYFKGKEEADRIVSEAASCGKSTACFAYDVADPMSLAANLQDWYPTAFYYFATPFIFSAVAGRFSSELFRTFCDCYVENFVMAFNIAVKSGPDLSMVMYPSSVALEQLPANMMEYVAAKTAGEALCAFLQKQHPGVHFSVPRLPRLATDQTASLIPTESPDPALHMLQLLHAMCSSEATAAL